MNCMILIEGRRVVLLHTGSVLCPKMGLIAQMLSANPMGSQVVIAWIVIQSPKMLSRPGTNRIVLLNPDSWIVLDHSVGMRNPVLTPKSGTAVVQRLIVVDRTATDVSPGGNIVGDRSAEMTAAEMGSTNMPPIESAASHVAAKSAAPHMGTTHVSTTETAPHMTATHVAAAETATHVASAAMAATPMTTTPTMVCINQRLADQRCTEEHDDAESNLADHGRNPSRRRKRNIRRDFRQPSYAAIMRRVNGFLFFQRTSVSSGQSNAPYETIRSRTTTNSQTGGIMSDWNAFSEKPQHVGSNRKEDCSTESGYAI